MTTFYDYHEVLLARLVKRGGDLLKLDDGVVGVHSGAHDRALDPADQQSRQAHAGLKRGQTIKST